MNYSFNNIGSRLTPECDRPDLTVSGSTCGTLVSNGPMTLTGPSGANQVFNVFPTQTITAT
ncbi:MAG TPA: hypothetical protein VI318_13885 [Baekduia sp.]